MADETKEPTGGTPGDSPRRPPDESRRSFLKVSGAAVGGVVAGGVIGGLIGNAIGRKNKPQQGGGGGAAPAPAKDFNQALMFFTQDQFRIAEAAAERIFPKDDLGPGAKELGVAYFIDHQMAGQYGMNGKDYMMGPFSKAEATQGYQASFKRHELITMGLEALNEYSQKKYSVNFPELKEDQQDEVLTAFEKGQGVLLKDVPGSLFFNLFRSLTIEGAYADPLYGGNKGMGGWKMKGYPGDQMAYIDKIEKDGFIKMDPASLHDHMGH
ncbi:gluconate 2-dehydrogenase subunit 3 family protein [Paenibacillus aurantius]|uniref:Gluconate 2-dehydrogenase subunit 3 family protein n=1 Tax=Paenibacillus aurantius TaxID=2918900 RepID=A0AA96RGW3_9BACL|nr:gluconate 2-dehydrogenase subunit 3 family protein [Paenibacillus aurantius]WNQ10484.1 gluconate 2-dehydrogenase subunit 3 family protein [Paenibacillus aurantius]